MSWLKKGLKHIWLPYTQMANMPEQLAVKKTKGVNIYLENGQKLIDGIASWWSVCHGYNHPHIIKAIKKQANLMPHIMLAGLANKPAYKLAERLSNFVNKDNKKHLNKVFFSDSGSTAVEVALKISVQYFLNQNIKTKTKIISFKNSYHGDTMGGMSLADLKTGMHAKFKNFLPKQFNIKLPKTEKNFEDFENFIKKNKNKTAAIILEPLIQAAGGMKFHEPEILERIIKIAKANNIITIFDECAVGFYRTGKKFAFHHTKITPDILCIGKALTGGTITLAATITTDKIFNKFKDKSLDKALMHGPTFMGNPLACAAANASLDLFEKENFEAKTKKINSYFKQELAKFKNLETIKNIRIIGATAIIEFKNLSWEETLKLREDLVKENIWLRPFSNVIYFMPPLSIKKNQIKKLISAVYKITDK